MSDKLTAEEARKIARPSVEKLVEIACDEIKKAAFNGVTLVEIKSELILNILYHDKELFAEFVRAMIELGYKYYRGWWYNKSNNSDYSVKFYY